MAPPNPSPHFIYKILSSAPTRPLPTILPLSPLDASDGFIHLSTAAQVPATASRFFADDEKLWVLKLSLQKLNAGKGDVRWEESGNEGSFPHLYGGDVGIENVEEVMEVHRGLGWEEALKELED